MVGKGKLDVDAALALLAHEASPRPSPELTAHVTADALLTILVREAHAAAPVPSPELLSRVLADAAAVAAPRPVAAPVRLQRRRRRVAGLAVGWAGGALASMALALAIGIGIGLETERPLPVLDDGASADPLALALAEPALMLMGGL